MEYIQNDNYKLDSNQYFSNCFYRSDYFPYTKEGYTAKNFRMPDYSSLWYIYCSIVKKLSSRFSSFNKSNNCCTFSGNHFNNIFIIRKI